jgi:hypothetical protein
METIISYNNNNIVINIPRTYDYVDVLSLTVEEAQELVTDLLEVLKDID